MRPDEIASAREYAELILSTDQPTTSPERTLARHVLGLVTLVERVQTHPPSEWTALKYTCTRCGEIYHAFTRELAAGYHDETHPDHRLAS